MRRLSLALSAALVLVLAGATAGAADQCFEDSLDRVFVAKALTLPAANGCKPFNGYISGVTSVVAGNVCKTDNNAFYFFNLHVTNGILDAYFVAFNISATSPFQGSGRMFNPGYVAGGSFTDLGFQKVPCPVDRFFGF